ncbi:hypothetical protein NDU88_005658 [Pleurodeles waltl]|uniref:Uncharacterized protein n=1 Tax=Pleurodeles waltl TaxID=8319 RepID=A0AAV7LUP9_PLEWA|nr:hypothetical protein NDU88_005658 [Pleurodeles waltl]
MARAVVMGSVQWNEPSGECGMQEGWQLWREVGAGGTGEGAVIRIYLKIKDLLYIDDSDLSVREDFMYCTEKGLRGEGAGGAWTVKDNSQYYCVANNTLPDPRWPHPMSGQNSSATTGPIAVETRALQRSDDALVYEAGHPSSDDPGHRSCPT